MSVTTAPNVDDFARANHLAGLTSPSLAAILEHKTGYTVEKARRFLRFQERIDRELLGHPVIRHNSYTVWFRQGLLDKEQVRAFILQFSVATKGLWSLVRRTPGGRTREPEPRLCVGCCRSPMTGRRAI